MFNIKIAYVDHAVFIKCIIQLEDKKTLYFTKVFPILQLKRGGTYSLPCGSNKIKEQQIRG